jgi:hypothetical protein
LSRKPIKHQLARPEALHCIVLDYSTTSILASRIRDKSHLIAPNFHLDNVFWDTVSFDFALAFPGKSVAVAGQSQIFIAAPVRTGAAETLADLLKTMNAAPGTADPANALVPFGLIQTIHVARFIILDDPSLPDRQQIAPQLPATEPLRLAFIADFDGTVDDLLRTLVHLATPGLQQIFSHCSDFDAHADLLAWLRAHRIVSAATYANWPGRSMTQIREEATLHAALRQTRLAHPQASPEQLRNVLLTAARSIPLTLLPVPTFTDKLAKTGDFLLLPLYVLLLSPLLVPALPFLILLLRWRETHDPVLAPVPSIARNKLLSSIEDRDVTNQYSAIGSLKPGLFRRWLTIAVLWIISWSGRHLFTTGRLGRVNTIHFASWTFLDNKRRLFFGSNYDGSREAYNDDFINKVAFGLNVSFSNGLGYPQTNWLIFDGARHEQDFKRYLFHHQIPTQVWYKAMPGLTTYDFARNTRIRQGLTANLTGAALRAWIAEI